MGTGEQEATEKTEKRGNRNCNHGWTRINPERQSRNQIGQPRISGWTGIKRRINRRKRREQRKMELEKSDTDSTDQHGFFGRKKRQRTQRILTTGGHG